MKKLLLPLLIGMAALAYFGLTWFEPITPIGSADNFPTTGGTGPERRSHRHSDDRGPTQGSEVERQDTDRHEIRITGRCLDANLQSPLGGCEIEIRAKARRFRDRRKQPTEVIGSTVTKPNGRFGLTVETAKSKVLEVYVRANGYADATGRLSITNRLANAGDVLMVGGARLTGRIVDEQHQPVGELSLRFYRQVGAAQSTIQARDWFTLKSDAAGNLHSTERLAVGNWSIRPIGEGGTIIEPATSIAITAGQESQDLTVVVRLPDPNAEISGRLIDSAGAPVPHAVVHARDASAWPIGYGYSKADGTFRCRCRKEPGAAVHLEVARANGFEPLRTTETYEWGTKDVALVLQRTGDMRIRVVADGDEAPVETYGIIWYQAPEDGRSAWQNRKLPAEFRSEGRAVVKAIPSGLTRIVILPIDDTLAPNEPVEFTKGNDQPELEIRLPAKASLTVRVLGGGQPIAGTRVELLRPDPGVTIALGTRAFDHSNHARRGQPGALRLDRGTTSRDGKVQLGWSAAAEELTLRVLGPGHIPHVHSGVVLSQDGMQVTVRVRAGGTLSGTVGPADVLEQLRGSPNQRRWRGLGPRVVLTYRGTDPKSRVQRNQNATIDADGTFECKGLIPGPWEVHFTATRFANGRGSNMGQKLLGKLQVTDGSTQRVTYDISDLRVASLRGRVFVNGALAAQRDIQLSRLSKGANRIGTAIQLRTDDRGSFHTTQITPGRYRLSIRGKAQDRRAPRLMSSSTVDVPPGADLTQDFHVLSGHLSLQIMRVNGSPAAEHTVQLRSANNGYAAAHKTDANGILTLEPIATGTYSVHVRRPDPSKTSQPNRFGAAAHGGFVEIGKCEATTAPRATPVRLTLPPK